MKLVQLLRHNFIIPLALSFFVITIISTVLTILFSDVYYNENLYTKIRTVEERKIAPMLKMTKELLYKTIQNKIDMLNILMQEFTNANTANTANTGNSKCNRHNVKNIDKLTFTNKNDDDTKYEDMATWFINPTTDKLDNASEEEELVNKFSCLIRSMKQFYKSKSDKPEFSFELFYIVNRKNHIVMTYPIKVNNTAFYKAFTTNGITNPIYCRDDDTSSTPPTYLYFACRIWYIQFTNLLNTDPSRSILISTPYEMKNEPISDSNMKTIIKGITICKKDSPHANIDDSTLFCVDILYNNIVTMLDNLNRRIPGYFFVMPTNIDIPIYYPNINNDDYYLTDITRFEFPLTQDHFINEVSDYKHNVIRHIIAEYNGDYNVNDVYGSGNDIFVPKKFYDAVQHTFGYVKGGAMFEYNIFPVVFVDKEGSDGSVRDVNLINIVYVVNKTEGECTREYCGLNVYYIAVVYSCHVVIVGCTLLAFFTEIITSIGKNLIYQINDFKKKIDQNADKDINTTTTTTAVSTCSNKSNSNNVNTTTVQTALLPPKQQNKSTPPQQQQQQLLNNNNTSSPDKRIIDYNNTLISSSLTEDPETESLLTKDDEEETLALRDKELKSKIDPFFVIKRIYPFLNKSLLTTNDNAFSELIQAREVFRKMGNAFGVSICQSNLGNHFNLLCKYDKAIPFFLSSLNISLTDNEHDNVYNYIDTIFDTQDVKAVKYYNRQGTTISNVNNNSTTNNNVNNGNASSSSTTTALPIVFSRFIKLFHAYRMFFSSIKHRAHYLDAIYNETKSTHSPLYTETKKRIMYSSDYFGEKVTHCHDAYYKCICICVNRCLLMDDVSKKEEKVAYALLELLHYQINTLKHKAKTSIKSLLSSNSNSNIDINNDDEYDDDEIINNNNGVASPTAATALKNVDIKHEAKKELKQYLTNILKITRTLTVIIDQLRNTFNNNKPTQYKTFLYELKHSIQNENENEIELNYHLLNQRFIYLKAKLAKFCGDYAKAIEHYVHIINDDILILNGVLYHKSNQKIINILSYTSDPRVNDVLQFTTINDKHTSERLISECTFNLTKLIQKQKDYVFIIDISCYNNNEQRKLQLMQIKTMRNVFENYVAEGDKICMYIFSSRKEHLHKIIPLSPKNVVTYGLINSFFDNLSNNMIVDGCKEEDDNDVYADMKMKYAIDAVFKAVGEVMEGKGSGREMVVFVFTESFQSVENRKVNKEMIGEFFKERGRRFDKPKLFIVGNLMADQDKLNYARDMFRSYFEVANYFEYENYQEIKKMLTTIGRFPRGYEYQNETFDR